MNSVFCKKIPAILLSVVMVFSLTLVKAEMREKLHPPLLPLQDRLLIFPHLPPRKARAVLLRLPK